MGLTPEQIAGVMQSDAVRTNQMANLLQLPGEMALRNAQTAKMLQGAPTIPVQTRYGTVMMDAEGAANHERALQAGDIAKQRVEIERAENQRQASQFAQSHQLNLDELAFRKKDAADRLASKDPVQSLAAAKLKEQQMMHINNAVASYAKGKGDASPAFLAQIVNNAPSDVAGSMIYTSQDGEAYFLDPSVLPPLKANGPPMSKDTLKAIAEEEKVSVTEVMNSMLRSAIAADPLFAKQLQSRLSKIKGNTSWYDSPLKVPGGND